MINTNFTYRHIARYLVVFAFLCNGQNLIAQNELPIHIRENMTLSEGVYKVIGTHYVSNGVDLIIKDNAMLVFEPNATIRIDGGLKIEGAPNKLITVTSRDKSQPGNGFVINGVSTAQSVNISYTRFDYIKKPITFEFRWSRKSVAINSNVIKRSLYEGAAVEVKEQDNLLTLSRIPFSFKDNTFSNSTSSLLISNITADLLTIDFDNNVITRNEYTGRNRNGIFTSPLYLTYNKYQNNEVPTIQHNSIFDNFYSLFYEDTFDIGRTNVSVIGNADKLDLSGNYFGNPDKREIQESFDYISANYQAPFLFTDNILPKPPSDLNGHFYMVRINDEDINENLILAAYDGEIDDIDLQFNRPVLDGKDYTIVYHYAIGDSISSVRIANKLKWSEGNQHLRISIQESLKKISKNGYLEIEGLYDSDGMDVPILTIGKKGLIDTELRTFVPLKIPSYALKKNEVEVSPDDTLVVFNPTDNALVEFERLNDSFVHLRQKYWTFGVGAFNSVYFGDLNSTTVSINPRNMRPGAGLSLGYQATEKWKFSITNNYMLISGSDKPQNSKNPNPRGTDFARDMSFRTFIADVNLMTEYSFTRYKLKSTFVPSVMAGVNAYYFKPMAKVAGDNQWYDLRNVGTGGQTLNGASQAYKKVMVGIPCGASIKRHLTQKTIVSLSYTYVQLFTDYLDDVAVDAYPDSEAVKRANPDLGPVAAALANPGNQQGNRSYSDKHDGYGYWGINFVFKIY